VKEREYLRKRQEIEDRCRRDLEVLERAWTLFNGDVPVPKPTPKSKPIARIAVSGNGPRQASTFSKRDAVRDALTFIFGTFGSRSVRVALDANYPEKSLEITDNQLAAIISRLASMGELVIVQPKLGRSPAIYRKKGDTTP
jgi:hypothetical protein